MLRRFVSDVAFPEAQAPSTFTEAVSVLHNPGKRTTAVPCSSDLQSQTGFSSPFPNSTLKLCLGTAFGHPSFPQLHSVLSSLEGNRRPGLCDLE